MTLTPTMPQTLALARKPGNAWVEQFCGEPQTSLDLSVGLAGGLITGPVGGLVPFRVNIAQVQCAHTHGVQQTQREPKIERTPDDALRKGFWRIRSVTRVL